MVECVRDLHPDLGPIASLIAIRLISDSDTACVRVLGEPSESPKRPMALRGSTNAAGVDPLVDRMSGVRIHAGNRVGSVHRYQ